VTPVVAASAAPVLLLHGQPGGARDWTGVVEALAGRADAIAVDRPGWDGRTRPLDIEGNVRAALALLDARRIERATIVGHSLGAAIAAAAAAHHPERVAALVLAAPAANLASVEPLDRWLAVPIAGYLAGAASLSGLGLALSAPPLRRRLVGESGLPEQYLTAAGRSLLTRWAWRAFATEQRALLRDLPALERSLPLIGAPTTIVTGAEDRVVPWTAPRKLAEQIPRARLVVLERAGHLLPQLHARRVADAIAVAVQGAANL
jgi:pimeloyl-ACP methyl ester carboxylesterase